MGAGNLSFLEEKWQTGPHDVVGGGWEEITTSITFRLWDSEFNFVAEQKPNKSTKMLSCGWGVEMESMLSMESKIKINHAFLLWKAKIRKSKCDEE